MIVGFALVYTVINLPWVLISGGTPALVQSDLPGVEVRPAGTNGWLHVWLFHAARYPDYSTVWYWIGERAPRLREDPWLTGSFTEFVGLASFGLFTAATCGMLLRGWLRRREPQGYPVVAVGFGVVVGFLLTSKVYSPQFSLWVVPLLAMLDIRYRWVFAYFAAEAAVFISGFRWFTVMSEPDPAWRRVLEVAVWSRAALLVLLLWQAMTAVRLFPMPSPKNPDLPRV